ncbi:adenylate/guanylate cyclase domain-containing protein [Ferrovibrio sp.]|uniref:adenylate/guanylate cyclase domain-containing protein n=1 Tax=Ferrovibrio sp. TaxID=1917215 RepID=UPI0025C20366|nr:adenylate/guanylate cyclase domain-containing protein [Ferrovibrio sp.]MBX3454077.1 adenylate/guanylate cyclase domain-containing protein [Ferrovibrio sp.]
MAAPDYLDDPVHASAPLEQWLLRAGLTDRPAHDLVTGFCDRLLADGVPIRRVYVGLATLHPLLRARGYTWARGAGMVENMAMPHREQGEEEGFNQAWDESPFRHMLLNGYERLSRPLTGPDAVLDFPVLREFAEQGLTDWLAYGYGFGWQVDHMPLENRYNQIGMIASFAADAPGGFSPAQRARLDHLATILALVMKTSALAMLARDVTTAYVGADAASHVLSGEIRRGMAHKVEAAILYADLRGFTALADSMAMEPLVEGLNQYFDCLGPAISAEGGQVLKFLGDGLLASFQHDGKSDPAPTCAAALRAAQAGLAAVEALNAGRRSMGLPVLQLDIALHLGTLMYGNVGTADRLDFTLIGPVVNEAARIENLCSMLDCSLLTSASFAIAANRASGRLISRGRHALRGVAEPREVFGL